MKAVVTDARLRIAVSIIRSLGEAGVPVVTAEAYGTRNILGFYSKYTSSRLRLGTTAGTAPSKSDLQALLDAAGEDGVIVPVFTSMVELLAEYAERTPGSGSGPRFLVPPLSSLRKAHDKAQCFRLAKSLGVPVPRTRFPDEEGVDAEDLTSLRKWAEGLPYPLMLKYRSGEDLGLSASKRYSIARSPDEAVLRYREMDALQEGPLAQEYVEGEDYGAAFLYDRDSRLVAAFTYKSIRERPKGAGPTVCAVSEARPELVGYGHRMLSALKWRGMAMLDFRRGLDGRFFLLEINPRFWGSLALSILAGVDFPMLYYRSCLGEDMGNAFVDSLRLDQEDGVKVRFFPQDFLSLPQYAKDARNGLGYLVQEGLRLLNPGLKDGLLSLSDPLPGLVYLVGGAFSRHGRT